MELLTNPVTQLLLPLAIVALMFALGATLGLADLRRVLDRPRGFVIGLATHALVLPLLAFGIAFALRLPPSLAVGLVLIASCPANATANLFTHLSRGDTMLSVCLTAAASLTSVATVPIFVNTALRLFPLGRSGVQLPVLTSALGLFLVATVPVIAGMGLRHWRSAAARAVEVRMGTIGLAVVLAVIATAVWSERNHIGPALAQAGAPVLLLNASSVSIAWGAAALFGLEPPQRVAVGLECGLQNFAMAAFISLTLLGDPALLMPGLAYGLLMWLSAGVVVFVARRA